MTMGAAPVLRLHGYAVSNYYNIVHAALLEKGAEFTAVAARSSQAEDFLAISPMGKVPVLETPQGWLAETVAILEYLEDTQGGVRLHPADAFARARCRQIMNVVQLYVEVPARSQFPGVFFGGANTAVAQAEARQMLGRAAAALRRLTRPRPFLLGADLAYADLFAFYCLDIAERVTQFVFDWSILAESGLDDWFAGMAERASSRAVLAEFAAAFIPYLVEKNAAYGRSAQFAAWRAAETCRGGL